MMMTNPVETLMRKYGYGYVNARNLVDEPYVKDLINENRELKREIKSNQRRIKRLQAKVNELKEEGKR